MVENPPMRRRGERPGRRSAAQWWNALAALLLALSLSGAGAVGPARAAPLAEWRFTYTARVMSAPRGPICVGSSHNVRVRVAKFTEQLEPGTNPALDENWVPVRLAPLRFQTVEGSVADPSIGILTPPSTITGGETPLASDAQFVFVANKAGSTQLNFTAYVDELVGRTLSTVKILRTGAPIQVVDCNYLVYTTAYLNFFAPNLASFVILNTVGTLKSQGGSALVGETTATWGASSFSQKCSHSHSFSPEEAPTTLQGQISQDGETLTITVGSASTHANTESCAASQGGEATAPGFTAQVSASEGGSIIRPYAFQWGLENLQGYVIINVEPVSAQ